jgi:hypothetical protein
MRYTEGKTINHYVKDDERKKCKAKKHRESAARRKHEIQTEKAEQHYPTGSYTTATESPFPTHDMERTT